MRDPSESTIAAQIISAQERNEIKVEVAETLRGAHELVRQANEELQGARTNEYGMIIRPEKPILDITTSKKTLRRALLIMDALLKALDQRGYIVSSGPVVAMLGTTLRFSISESMEAKREAADDHELDGPYTFGHNRFKETHAPSGRLTLTITEGGAYWLNGCRYTWRDTKKKRLEERLRLFVAGLMEMAARIKEHDEQEKKKAELRRQEELRLEEEARQLAEKRKQFTAEKARVAVLLKQAKGFRLSKLVRELVEAVTEAHSKAGPIPPDSEIAQWIEWATKQADRLDPLRPSPPSILDENIPEDKSQYGSYRRW